MNNAGITYYGKTVEMSDEHWDRVLRINLYAHLQFTRELLPSLLARPEAHVLNTCSMFGLFGAPKLAAYCTTKFALVGFSDALRAEYGRDGLGVTALCPGFVRTNLFTSAPQHETAKEPKVPPKFFQHYARKSRPRPQCAPSAATADWSLSSHSPASRARQSVSPQA